MMASAEETTGSETKSCMAGLVEVVKQGSFILILRGLKPLPGVCVGVTGVEV